MKYLNITYPDISNGLGCRVTLWIPGCTNKCPFCHNQWTWDYNQGEEFNDNIKNSIKDILNKPYISGITISGGDPLCQSKEVLNELKLFLKDIKEQFPTKNVWLYTGLIYERLYKEQLDVLEYVDILVDGPFKNDLKDLSIPFRGSTNQRIIDLKTKKELILD